MTQPVEVRSARRYPQRPRPNARQWTLHGMLLLLTFCTVTICGVVWTGGLDLNAVTTATGASGSGRDLLLLPVYYVRAVIEVVRAIFANPALLKEGLKFSLPLLAILASHESGHYLFCRYYGVEATLPFFIPQPPLFLFPGTFGAFIRMKSAVPTRRALFDIGLAGPLAGFVVIVPVAIAGILTLHHINIPPGESGLTFHDPLLFRLIALLFRIDLDNSAANSLYLAAWVGVLVTALNLMPVGQLDGGHGTFAMFGPIAHWWIGRIAFLSMVAVTFLGWWRYGTPIMILYVILLGVMLRVRHPAPQQIEPLGSVRVAIGIVTLLVFALSFLPFPITFG